MEGGMTYSVAGCVDDAFDAPAYSLEGIGADACSALGEAFDSLAGFGREILRCFTAVGYRQIKSQ